MANACIVIGKSNDTACTRLYLILLWLVWCRELQFLFRCDLTKGGTWIEKSWEILVLEITKKVICV